MNNNDSVNTISLILQALSLQILFQDYNNTDLMQELQKQDTKYFETIIKNQKEILDLLKKGSETNGRKSD